MGFWPTQRYEKSEMSRSHTISGSEPLQLMQGVSRLRIVASSSSCLSAGWAVPVPSRQQHWRHKEVKLKSVVLLPAIALPTFSLCTLDLCSSHSSLSPNLLFSSVPNLFLLPLSFISRVVKLLNSFTSCTELQQVLCCQPVLHLMSPGWCHLFSRKCTR